MNLRSSLVLLLCLWQSFSFAQEQLGIRLDNYAGINATLFNPAGHTTMPFSWDLNLIEGSQFIDNNYAFIRNARVPNLFNSNLDIVLGPRVGNDTPLKTDQYAVDFFDDGRKRYIFNSSRYVGPSFFFRVAGQHYIGLVTGGRFLLGGNGLTDNLSYYPFNRRPDFEPFSVDPFRIGMVGFEEIGLNYAFRKPTAVGNFSFGITAKYLRGYEAAFVISADEYEMTRLPENGLFGDGVHLEFGYTDNLIREDVDRVSPLGSGYSVDLGFVYTIGGEEGAYDWKFSGALMDIGQLKFNKQTNVHLVNPDEPAIVDGDNYSFFDSGEEVNAVVELFSLETLGDRQASLVNDAFNIWLPSRLNLHVDKAIWDNDLYLGMVIMQTINPGSITVPNGNLVAVVPRYESRWIGASMPVSMYNLQKFRVGLSLRLPFLTIGTDHLGSWITPTDLSGTDFYIALKINPFRIGGGGNSPFPNRRGNDNIPCYKF
ncbi:MAG: hypothetical protein HRU41_00880 [Saprospiraceae bacterium]|nr:hypothetical protein [Saprospiraceae bacterium]